MYRRTFLTGLLAAAAAPTLPATASPLIEMFPQTLVGVQLEISRRVAELWDKEVQHAFVLTMEQCFK